MDIATWCPTPAAASAASRLRVEVVKNSSTAASSNDGEFETSTTTAAPSQGGGRAVAGDGVDAGVGRRGEGLVAVLAEQVDELRSDAPGAADDDDLHGLTTFVLCRSLAPRSDLDRTAPSRVTRRCPAARACHRSPPSPVHIVASHRHSRRPLMTEHVWNRRPAARRRHVATTVPLRPRRRRRPPGARRHPGRADRQAGRRRHVDHRAGRRRRRAGTDRQAGRCRRTLPTMLYVHGGGWVLGNSGTHDRLVRELAVGATPPSCSSSTPAPPRPSTRAIEQAYATAQWIIRDGRRGARPPSAGRGR